MHPLSTPGAHLRPFHRVGTTPGAAKKTGKVHAAARSFRSGRRAAMAHGGRASPRVVDQKTDA
jgi:hypothetical protein